MGDVADEMLERYGWYDDGQFDQQTKGEEIMDSDIGGLACISCGVVGEQLNAQQQCRECEDHGQISGVPSFPQNTQVARSYDGASMLALQAEEADKLAEGFGPDEVDIRPDGLVYLPQTFFRRRLNSVFGPGSWCMIPRGPLTMDGDGDQRIMYREYALFVRGSFIAEAVGGQRYFEKNPEQDYSAAAESVKSDAITRTCKDLGIASELWDPAFVEKWKATFSVKVWNEKKGKFNWRRKDREPFWWEKKSQEQAPPQQKEKPPTPPSEPESAAPPQHIDDNEAQGEIEELRIKDGKTAKGNPWKNYSIQVGGVWYSTFDTKLGATLEEAHNNMAPVSFAWKLDATGKREFRTITRMRDDQPNATETESAPRRKSATS